MHQLSTVPERLCCHCQGTSAPRCLLGLRKMGGGDQGACYCCPTLSLSPEQPSKKIRDWVLITCFLLCLLPSSASWTLDLEPWGMFVRSTNDYKSQGHWMPHDGTPEQRKNTPHHNLFCKYKSVSSACFNDESLAPLTVVEEHLKFHKAGRSPEAPRWWQCYLSG